MIISFDLKVLKEKNLTPEEFTILKCLNDGEYEGLNESIRTDKPNISIEAFNSLESKGYIKIGSNSLDLRKIHFRQLARDLFGATELDKKFAELYSMYPIKVPDGRGGYRILRAKNTDSSDAKVAKEKFNKLCKSNPTLADTMIKGLEKQLETTRGSLQYLQQFNVWLNQRTYEKYVDLEEENSEDSYREKL